MLLLDQKIWKKILKELDFHISKKSFNTFFNNTKLVDLKENSLTIEVETSFATSYLNKNYKVLLEEIAFGLYKIKYNIFFIKKNIFDISTKIEKKYNKESEINLTLNGKFTFDQFIVGKNNNFAFSAAFAASKKAGLLYSPFFIYGKSGMGKTHLMQAIGNYIHSLSKKNVIYYITAEDFTNKMISCIKNNTIIEFKNIFRNIDVLLIDDIQFFKGKKATQEEFFHTFNSLINKKKQIVLTSDKPPKDIEGLEKRLVTRFNGGLIVDLSIPEFETRVAIIEKKAENDDIKLSNKIINFIAENIVDNIRSLEGAIIRLLAYSSFHDIEIEKISIDLAKKILNDLVLDNVQKITLENIKDKICDLYNLTNKQIFSKSKKKNIVFPRQIGMYLSYKLIPGLSLVNIAKYYKRKDHSTVINAKKIIEISIKKNISLDLEIKEIIQQIKY